MADVTRNANVHWEGDVRRGSGNIDLLRAARAGACPSACPRVRPTTRAARPAPKSSSPPRTPAWRVCRGRHGSRPGGRPSPARRSRRRPPLDLLVPPAVTVLGLVS